MWGPGQWRGRVTKARAGWGDPPEKDPMNKARKETRASCGDPGGSAGTTSVLRHSGDRKAARENRELVDGRWRAASGRVPESVLLTLAFSPSGMKRRRKAEWRAGIAQFNTHWLPGGEQIQRGQQ